MRTALFMVISVLVISVGMLNIKRDDLTTNISDISYSDNLHKVKNNNYKKKNQNYALAEYTEENFERAKNIHSTIMRDNRINNSYIIVNENYAIIGLELNKDFKNQDLRELENKITSVDDIIENIVIIEDEKLVSDLKEKSNYGII